MGEIKNALKILVGKPVRKRSLVELQHSVEDDSRMNLTEIRYMCVWIGFM
jgi:hypothetical protein